MSDQAKPRPALAPKDLADLTGMSVDFFYLEIEAGELHAARFGRFWRIPADEAERYLREKKFPPPVTDA